MTAGGHRPPLQYLRIRAVSARRSGENLLSVGERHVRRVQKIGAVLRQRSVDGDIFADLEIIPRPTAPDEHGRRRQFDFPVGDFAAGIFHVHEETRVRIDPIDFGDGTNKGCGFIPVILGGE